MKICLYQIRRVTNIVKNSRSFQQICISANYLSERPCTTGHTLHMSPSSRQSSCELLLRHIKGPIEQRHIPTIPSGPVSQLKLDLTSSWSGPGPATQSRHPGPRPAVSQTARPPTRTPDPGRVQTFCTVSRRPRRGRSRRQLGRRSRTPLPLRPAGLWRRLAGAKAKSRAAETRGSHRSRGGFDTGTPRGGSIGLTRATWKAARSRTSVQPPPPCQIRRSVGAVPTVIAASRTDASATTIKDELTVDQL